MMIQMYLLGGQCIFVGEYNDDANKMSTLGGMAGNTFTVRKGTCRIQAHVIAAIPGDSFCMSISGATT